jgi:hypothetical protein
VAPPGSGAETFWVTHVDQKLELGWQNLPSSTTYARVSRAAQGGEWKTLLEQNNPVDPYFIRLIDATLHEAHQYKLEVFSGVSLIGIFGPVTLDPL